MKSFDIVIIGGGPGGYVAAIRAAQQGLNTAVIEKEKMGGICLNWGCIPTKTLLKSASQMSFLNKAEQYGFKVGKTEPNFPAIIKRSREVANTNAKGVDFLMKKNKISVLKGRARLSSTSTITLFDKKNQEIERIESKHIIIATGSRPRMIPGAKWDGKQIITSSEALVLKKPPESMVIIGAGAIGMEFAYLYHTFGTQVTVVEMLPQILPAEDEAVSKALQKIYQKSGMEILTQSKVDHVDVTGNKVTLTVSQNEKTRKITAETCLIAIGVQGNIEELGLEDLNIQTKENSIVVDAFGRTNVQNIYAIGDVVGAPCLAHVASHEGLVCVDHIAGLETHPVNLDNIPHCTYCQPQVASIGLTEKQAKEKGFNVKIGTFPFSANGKARAIGETDGFVKVIFDAEHGELLGAHLLGPEATELIAEFGVLKTLEATYEDVINTIHAHPTLSETIFEAVLDSQGQALHF